MTTISSAELKNRLNHVTLIDVRTPAEFEEVHIPGSHLVPLHTLDDAKARDLAGRAKEWVLVCRSGNRARQAAEKLAAAGADQLLVLEGGITAWESTGGQVHRGRKTISIERQVRIGAGSLVLLGVILGVTLNLWFLVLSAFVGCGLIFAGITDWCGMGLLLARMPWNNRSSSTTGECGAACAR
ncbi:MAG: rhodanese-like domain-containing protein [Candidatus Methylacidiphilales bacterium]